MEGFRDENLYKREPSFFYAKKYVFVLLISRKEAKMGNRTKELRSSKWQRGESRKNIDFSGL